MKAVLCKAFGPASSLVLEEIASPSPAKNEILLDVHAAGVNFPDTLIIEGKYQFKPPFPFSPGGEAAGVVAAVGEKVAHVRPGDRVMALTGWGSFAEQVKVPGYNVMPIPEGMDFASAAAFGMTYGTSMHALKQRANLQPGETLLVLGASGGVGLAAVEIGKAMGARVIAAASTPDKLAVAKAAGADELINYSEGSLREQLKALTGGQGVDVIYDPVGGELFENIGAERVVDAGGQLAVREGPGPAFAELDVTGGVEISARPERTDAGGRLRQRQHPFAAGQPDPAQGRLAGRRVLGIVRPTPAAGQR